MPSTPDSFTSFILTRDDSGQPWDDPIDPETDAPRVPAVFLDEDGDGSKDLAIWPDGNDLRFRDVANPGSGGTGYTLSELIGGAAVDSGWRRHFLLMGA